MNTYQMLKDAIDFKEIKSQRSSLNTRIAVKRERIQRCPEDRAEVEKAIAEVQAQIPALDAILAKEPPPPELPPRKPLIKVSGVLEEFEILCVKGYFSDQEYDPEEFARQEERNQFGALLLAMMGNSAAAAATSRTKERLGEKCHFVQGKINGLSFHGWLGLTTAKIGDYVEIRTKARDEVFYTFYILFAAIVICIGSVVCSVKDHFWDGAEMVILWWVFISSAISPYMYYLSIKKPFPSVKLAQDIFTALGFPNPENISLEKLTKKRIKEMKFNPSIKNGNEVLPDNYGFLSHFYYY
ncbi:hypothetical protein QPK13_23705 [Photorhabdus tasmaniensis]|uniref:hypothetical protein n=1 Tax=Photorhabdus sp. RM323S TaxID=3342828 RepID=UPI0036DE1E4A